MSFNKYNTRNTGRYNTPGQFVSAGEGQQRARTPQNNQQQNQFGGNWQQPPPPPPQENTFGQDEKNEMPPPPPVENRDENEDINMKMESETDDNDDSNSRPHWMKSKLSGVKKISNKERRRRQNQSLRRLLTPKNALMVLNEMLPNEQLATQFQVMPTPSNNQYYKPHSFCADLNLDGNKYTGYGDNKLMARNAAAEQAIRDLIIKRMNKAINTEGSQGEEMDEDTLPMIQLASFALHKLFCEWEVEGFKVPQLRPVTTSVSESEGGSEAGLVAGAVRAKQPKKPKQLPADAAHMHPCMLLTYMRPALAYRELAARGDRPQNMQYTIGLDVDGVTYVGTASNKKEARKAAAKAACQAIFGVKFEQPQVTA
ncbi:unnamed protein product [Parnassius mnemosyne]|uniref:DRBM domain-containing protein n=1 Tax=Parnassius mnemosyne TaxID=213953 RepID=A0AAV1KC92_9NEOP